jgi:hypothetical protein
MPQVARRLEELLLIEDWEDWGRDWEMFICRVIAESPLVAFDALATLAEFHHRWARHCMCRALNNEKAWALGVPRCSS